MPPALLIADGLRRGSFIACEATAVGNNEKPVAKVGGTKGGCWYAIPFRIVPALGQVPENGVESLVSVGDNVFQEDESRSNMANDSCDLRPKMPWVRFAKMLASFAERLARVACGEEVERPEFVPFDIVYILHPWNIGPVFRENTACVLVYFYLSNADPPGPLKAKVKATYSRHEREECWHRVA